MKRNRSICLFCISFTIIVMWFVCFSVLPESRSSKENRKNNLRMIQQQQQPLKFPMELSNTERLIMQQHYPKSFFEDYEMFQDPYLYLVKQSFGGTQTYVVCDPDDYFTSKVLWIGYYPDLCIIQQLIETLTPLKPYSDDIMLDIGANLGFISTHMAKMGYNVIGFEPHPNNIHKFRQSVRLNGIATSNNNIFNQEGSLGGSLFLNEVGLGSDDHAFFNVALYSKDSDIAMDPTGKNRDRKLNLISNGIFFESDDQLETLIKEEKKRGNTVIFDEIKKVPVRRLDSLLTELIEDENCILKRIEQIKFVKIDCEGYETKVFEGGIEFFRKVKPVIYSEVNEKLMARFDMNVHDMLDMLIYHVGYSLYIPKGGGKKLVFVENIDDLPILSDVVLIPKHKNSNPPPKEIFLQ